MAETPRAETPRAEPPMDEALSELERAGRLDPEDAALRWRRLAAAGRQRLEDVRALEAELEDPARRRAALEALRELGPAGAAATGALLAIAAEADVIDDAQLGPLVAALRAFGPGAGRDLLRGLESPVLGARFVATHGLAAITEDWPEAVMASCGERALVGRVAQRLADEDGAIRAKAAELLRRIGPPAAAALPALAARLARDDDRDVRILALLAMRRIGPGRGQLGALIASLQDHDRLVRLWAARALGEMGAEAADARPALYHALLDGRPGAREAAQAALERIQAALEP